MRSLELMKTDCTYQHGYLAQVLKDRSLKGLWTGTIDSTAFTDRFPTRPQVAIVNSVLGQRIRDLWIKVLSDRDFKVTSGKLAGRSVSYASGQPIGLYSS